MKSSFRIPPPNIYKKEKRFSFFFSFCFVSIAILFLLKVIRLYYPTPQFLAWHSGSGDSVRSPRPTEQSPYCLPGETEILYFQRSPARLSFKVTRLQEVLHQPVFQRGRWWQPDVRRVSTLAASVATSRARHAFHHSPRYARPEIPEPGISSPYLFP